MIGCSRTYPVRLRLVPIGLLLIVAMLLVPRLISTAERNMGWLQLATAMTTAEHSQSAHEERLQSAIDLFSRAVSRSSTDQSAWLGLAMASAHVGDQPAVVNAWRAAGAPAERLIEYGNMQYPASPQLALLYFLSAQDLSPEGHTDAYYAAARVCRSQWAARAQFEPKYADYCAHLVQMNKGNLIFNGGFDDGVDLGWEGRFFFIKPEHAVLYTDPTAGVPSPSAVIQGISAQHHQGIGQTLCLRPGTQVHYSAHFRVESHGNFQARLLYIGWRADDKVNGNQAEILTSTRDWTYLERTWTVPENAEPQITFQPLILTGQAQVWIDDVRVTTTEPPQDQTDAAPLTCAQ